MNSPKKISTYNLSCIVESSFFLILSQAISFFVHIISLIISLLVMIVFVYFITYDERLIFIILSLIAFLWFASPSLISAISHFFSIDSYDSLWRNIYIKLIKIFSNKKLNKLMNHVNKYNDEVKKLDAIKELIEVGYSFDINKVNKAVEYLSIDREDLIRSLKTESIFRNNRRVLSNSRNNKYDNSYSSSINYQGNRKAKMLLDEMFEDAKIREQVKEFNK